MDDFQNKIKEWVSIDNKIKVINDQLKVLREERNSKTNNILNHPP